MTFVMAIQIVLIYLFATCVAYGSESNGANVRNSYLGVHGGTSGTYTLPNNFYSKASAYALSFVLL